MPAAPLAAAALLLALLPAGVAPVVYNPDGSVRAAPSTSPNWTNANNYVNGVKVNWTDSVVFAYSSSHNVVYSPAGSCPSVGSTVGPTSAGVYTFAASTFTPAVPTAGGTVTLLCSQGSHCSAGQIVTITINARPSSKPTSAPTRSPSRSPSKHPSRSPSRSPSVSPSASKPSRSPYASPSLPTGRPTKLPSSSPTRHPSRAPTYLGQTLHPSRSPSHSPSHSPLRKPSQSPSVSPVSRNPTFSPSTMKPSLAVTHVPVFAPTKWPVMSPSASPSESPTFSPSSQPSSSPTGAENLGVPLLIDMGGGPAYYLSFASSPSCSSLTGKGSNITTLLSSPCLVHIHIDLAARAWIGVGVAGPDSQVAMVGGYAVIACDDPSKPRIGLYWLSGQTSLDQIVLLPGTLEANGILQASFVLDAAHASLDFTLNYSTPSSNFIRLFNLGDVHGSGRRLLQNASSATIGAGVTEMIFSQGISQYFDQHAYRASYAIDLVSGNASASTIVMSPVLAAHIGLAVAGMGLLLPMGALFGYLHPLGTSSWFAWHWRLQIAGSLVLLSAWGCALAYVAQMGETHFAHPHNVVGQIVTAFVVVQILNGLLRPHKATPAGAQEDKNTTQGARQGQSEDRRTSSRANPLNLVLLRELSTVRRNAPSRELSVAGGGPSQAAQFAATPPQESAARKTWFIIHRLVAFFTLILGGVNFILARDVVNGVLLAGSAPQYVLGGTTFSGASLTTFCTVWGAFVIVAVVLGFAYSKFGRSGQAPLPPQNFTQEGADGDEEGVPLSEAREASDYAASASNPARASLPKRDEESVAGGASMVAM